jgi:hypothetical protein
MPPIKRWVSNPDSGGIKIPGKVKRDIEVRINKVAEEQFRDRYTRMEIRFRAQFCYIDAYTEPQVGEGWPPDDWSETREEFIQRLRNTPIHLCRLRYFGDDRWGFAFYTYSNERYEFSIFPSGDFIGKAEDAFITAAQVYLNEG